LMRQAASKSPRRICCRQTSANCSHISKGERPPCKRRPLLPAHINALACWSAALLRRLRTYATSTLAARLTDAATVSQIGYGVFLSLLRTPAASARPRRRVASAENRYRRPCRRFAPCEFDPLERALSRQFSPDTGPVFSSRCVELIRELQDGGAIWAINTGRSVDLLEKGLAEFALPIRPDFILTTERDVFRPGQNGERWEPFGNWNQRCARD